MTVAPPAIPTRVVTPGAIPQHLASQPVPSESTSSGYVLDDGSGDFSTLGRWSTDYNPAGFAGAYHYIQAGSRQATATWQTNGVAPGNYEIQVTWPALPVEGAPDAPYRIYDGTTLLATIRVDQRQNPSGVSVGGSTFQSLGTFTISGGTLRIVLGNDAANGNPYDFVEADAVRVLTSSAAPSPPPPPSPPSVILDDAQLDFSSTGPWAITSGYGEYGSGFHYIPAGTGQNTATWQAGGLAPGYYEVQATWPVNPAEGAPDAPYRIYDGSTLLATIRIDQRQTPSGVSVGGATFQNLGAFNITGGNLRVVLGDDTAGGNPYYFIEADAIRVVASPVTPSAPQPPVTVDDANPGFSANGPWGTVRGYGEYGSGFHYIPAGTGQDTATWQAGGLAPGNYEVQATWPVNPAEGAPDAPYRIYDGSTLLATVRVDQQQRPANDSAADAPFQDLGVFPIAGGTLRVVLGNDAAGGNPYYFVEADAVRAVPIPAATGPGLVVCDGNSLTFGYQSTNPRVLSYPAQLQTILGPGALVVGEGVNGQTTEAINAQTALQATPQQVGYSRGVAVIWEGTNSINALHDSAAAAFLQLVRYVRQRHAAGYKVIVLTCLPATGAAIGDAAGFEAARQEYNRRILVMNGAGADAVVDVASDPRLSDSTNLAYFSPDQVHLNDSGYAVVASLVAPAVQQLLS